MARKEKKKGFKTKGKNKESWLITKERLLVHGGKLEQQQMT